MCKAFLSQASIHLSSSALCAAGNPATWSCVLLQGHPLALDSPWAEPVSISLYLTNSYRSLSSQKGSASIRRAGFSSGSQVLQPAHHE